MSKTVRSFPGLIGLIRGPFSGVLEGPFYFSLLHTLFRFSNSYGRFKVKVGLIIASSIGCENTPRFGVGDSDP